MAVLARRTWAQILTETLLRLGNPTTTGMDGRVQYWLWEAYQDLCTTYHHFELDGLDSTVTCSTSTNEITLPSSCFILVSVRIKAVGGASIVGNATIEDFRAQHRQYRTTDTGVPTSGARFGNKFYFNKLPDAAYPLELAIYKHGTSPDFSATSPETGADVDGHLIEAALRRSHSGLGRPDLGDVNRQLLTEWLAQQVRATADTVSPLPERSQANTTLAGSGG